MGYNIANTPGSDDSDHLLASWLEIDRIPRVIIDGFQSVIWKNAAASAFFQASKALSLTNKVLHVTDQEQQARFRTNMHAHCDKQSHFLISGHNGECVWIQFDRISDFWGLTFRSNNNPIYADFRSLFLLTSKEDSVLRLLLGGAVAETIAAANEVSIVTVRSHIRSIYSKMNVNSREALLAKAAVYRIA